MTNATTLKFDDAFENKLAAAVGKLYDDGNLPQGLGRVLDSLHIENNSLLLSPDATQQQPTVGYAGRFLGQLLVVKAYLEARSEHYDYAGTGKGIKFKGQEEFEQCVEEYLTMLRVQFAKMPEKYRDEVINEFSAYAGERIDLKLNYINPIIEAQEQPKSWFKGKKE